MVSLICCQLFSANLQARNHDSIKIPDLPEPVTNNAVALVENNKGRFLVSFSGLANNKTYHDVHNKTFVYRFGDNGSFLKPSTRVWIIGV